MEQRLINEFIRSSGRDWRGIEMVEPKLHVSLVGHGAGDCSVENSRNKVRWCEMSSQRGGGVFTGGWRTKFEIFRVQTAKTDYFLNSNG
jgi:hypothetical protein